MASTLGSKDLARGMKGSTVKALQTDLTIVGYTVKVSGDFGSKTEREVKAFQKHYGLSVDGVVGPDTKKQLLKVLNKDEGDTSTGTSASSGSGSGTGTTTSPSTGGGSGFNPPPPKDTKMKKASLVDGLALPASGTPQAIVDVIDAANRIAFKQYIYGGGHTDYSEKTVDGKKTVTLSKGYDCSGSVSFALHADGDKPGGKSFLTEPLDSAGFASYGDKGTGNWITIYTDPSAHAYAVIAGVRFDTVAQDFNKHGSGLWKFGDRWTTSKDLGADGYAAGAFKARHPAGW